uniref:F-box domain-containing protein n=1 Tax=Caenorhabditis tropicalis TaxID=1561998 RepID=A0A1I7UTS2_9PELO
MHLLRLPLLVLIDVFKKMTFDEKFLISLLSKRARNTLKLTSVPVEFSIITSEDLYVQSKNFIQSSREPEDTSDYLIGGEMINQKKLTIGKLNYHITGDSSEFIPRVLDECTEVTDMIWIDAKFPDDFEYTSPRPFKSEEFRVDKTVNWFNLAEFMSCRHITVQLLHMRPRTEQYWSSFFTKWMDSDARLQKLTFYFIEEPEFRKIMNVLGNQGTKRTIDEKWFEIKRRDGSEYFIEAFTTSIDIYTKHAYLEKLKRKEAFDELARKIGINLRI